MLARSKCVSIHYRQYAKRQSSNLILLLFAKKIDNLQIGKGSIELSDWSKTVEPPLILTKASDQVWDEGADMLVIGLGGAGVSAALEGLERGLSVIAIERFEGGGATKASGGVVYLGGGTSTQTAAGVEDDPSNMFAYLKHEAEDIVPEETLSDFCETSPLNEDWLQTHGVRFDAQLWSKKTSYPNAEYFLYHSDNSLIAPYKESARPAARGHRGWVPLKQGRKAINLGGSVFDPLRQSARAKGLKETPLAEVTQMVVGGDGEILGVKAMVFPEGSRLAGAYRKARARSEKWMTMYPPILPGSGFFFRRGMAWAKKAAQLLSRREPRFFRANKGVVISAGGFAFNRKMMKAHAPKFSSGYPLGTEGDDGAGITLGKSVGGKTGNMSRATAWRFINPPYGFAEGIIVNRAGKRFINEMKYGAHIGVEIGENQHGEAWLIIDKALASRALNEVAGSKALPFQRDLARLNIWLAAKKGSLSTIAQDCGIDLIGLEATIAQYNQRAGSAERDTFGKDGGDCAALAGPKFYAIDVGLAAKLFPCPVLTLGGLLVDPTSGAVLKEESDGVVAGLYAAGRSAVGICSRNYVSGLSIADCVYSGRRAAAAIAGQKS